MLKTFVFAGAQQPLPEEATGTLRGPSELLLTGSGYRGVITTDLVDDPLLTDTNIENFKKACDFAMVRPEYFPAGKLECDHPLPEKIRKAENRCE
jgi:hypothetical protein